MVDVATEVAESLLVVPEAFKKLVGDALAQVAELDRLLRDALLERHDLAPCGRTRLPDGGGTLERTMLVEQGVPKSWLPRNAPDRGLKISGDDLEDRRLAGAVAADDPPSLAFGDGEGDVLEEFGGTEGDADVGDGEKRHAEMLRRPTGGATGPCAP